MDEPRAYYTECSTSEREKQISFINAHIYNLERWYWCNYLQGSNGNRHRGETCGHWGRGGEGGMNGESSIETYPPVCKNCQWELKLGLCDKLEDWDPVGGGREVQEWGDISIPVVMLMYGRNQHDIVKKLSLNEKEILNRKRKVAD